MPHDFQQPTLVQETFTFEEYIEAIAGIDGRVMITDREQAPWTAETVDLDGITLQRMFEGGSNTYEGESAEGVFCLFLKIPTPAEIYAYGQILDDDSMAMARPGKPVTSITKGRFHYYALTVPTEHLVGAQNDYDPVHTKRLLNGPAMVDITPECRRRAADTAGAVIAAAGSAGILDHPEARRAAASELIDSFLAAFTSRIQPTRNGGRPRIPRTRLLRRIRGYLHQTGPRELSVPELSAKVGVAERTLRYVFKEQFGVAPKEYLQLLQLHDIRADLLRGRTGATVTTVATDHGVWNLGRFAQRYRRVFGEAPSRTLAAARSTSL